jgi:hypothetical protein
MERLIAAVWPDFLPAVGGDHEGKFQPLARMCGHYPHRIFAAAQLWRLFARVAIQHAPQIPGQVS